MIYLDFISLTYKYKLINPSDGNTNTVFSGH